MNGLKTKIAAVAGVLIAVAQLLTSFGVLDIPGSVIASAAVLAGSLGFYGIRDKLERMGPGS